MAKQGWARYWPGGQTKNVKQWAVAIALAAIALGLAACGSNNQADSKPDIVAWNRGYKSVTSAADARESMTAFSSVDEACNTNLEAAITVAKDQPGIYPPITSKRDFIKGCKAAFADFGYGAR